MKVAIGADHAGYWLKEKVKNFLSQKEIECQDFGCYNTESTDYPDWGVKVAEAVAKNEFDRGILICGTGMGMCMVANKIPGIRAVSCYGVYAARLSREHNDSNILTLGGRITGEDLAKEIVEEWLKTEFKGDRHKKRVDKIRKIEEKYFKK
ncbi:MAG: ribose 5-phosphate isomerase B [Candidatus Aerophobetes bacterium]|nr:ribose 5-phosphate isomerase B [Candidatus Aerophobetes bacterium]